jgi:antibiotic biosynthesis monooxygenase (ABM) superfamily enzyme
MEHAMTAPTELAPPTADGPVTVAITRRVAAGDTTQMIAWVRAGTAMAELFPGFLGAGWVRPGDASDEWHMLYRFADHESLDAWETSTERQWWLRSGEGLVEHTRAERRTGIEGWFDPPESTTVEAPAGPKPPPRWKQSLLIWMAFFPVNLLATLTLGALLVHWPVVLRVLCMTVVLTPIMTYLVLPALTRRMEGWLHR